MSDKKYQVHMKFISNAYKVTQNKIIMLSNEIPINEDSLNCAQRHLEYLTDKINELSFEQSNYIDTDTKPAMNI